MKLLGKVFAEHLSATTSHIMLLFFVLQISKVCSLNQIVWYSNGKFGDGIHKLCQTCVVMETSLSSCGHTCTKLGISIAREVEEKEELENLLKWG